MSRDIEDGMGFSSLLPSNEEREEEARARKAGERVAQAAFGNFGAQITAAPPESFGDTMRANGYAEAPSKRELSPDKKESATPRTDAAMASIGADDPQARCWAEEYEKLERELAEAEHVVRVASDLIRRAHNDLVVDREDTPEGIAESEQVVKDIAAYVLHGVQTPPSATGELTEEELQRLIDHHDNAGAGAEAQDYIDAARYHDLRSDHFKKLLDAIKDKQAATLKKMVDSSKYVNDSVKGAIDG